MSRKSKIDPTEKVKIVERILAKEIGVSAAARLTGVDGTTIRRWRNLYLADGPTALMVQRNNKLYSRELKLQAVHEYLDGKSSQADIVKNYHLRSSRQLHDWIKVYTTHGEIKSRTSGGGSYMRKARPTTSEDEIQLFLSAGTQLGQTIRENGVIGSGRSPWATSRNTASKNT